MALLLCALFGLVVERFLVRPFAERGSNGWLMATVAGGIVLDNIVLFTFGKEPRGFPSILAQKPIELFGAGVFPLQLVIPLVGLGIALALHLRSIARRLGKALLAVVQNKDAARLMGINVRVAIALSFALSTALAGLAGLLIAPLFSVHSDMGTLFGIKAFAVAILGGITSASGVMLAGLLYGLIEALVTAFVGSVYTQIVAFAVVIVALAVMPNGLLGRAGDEEGVDDASRALTPMTLAIAGADRGRRRAGVRVRRLYAFHARAGRADGGRRRRAQRAARPDRPGLARPCRLLRHRRLHGGDPDAAAASSFWLALPLAGLMAGADRRACWRCRRCASSGPYLAMITIAFAFIVQHGTIEWKALTGGQNGLMGLVPPTLARPRVRRARDGDARDRARRPFALSVPAPRRERLGQGDGRGARQRDRGALDRAQSGDDQDRGFCHLGGVRGARRRDLRAADDVRRAGLVSVLAVDPVSARRHRRRRRLGVRARRSARSSRCCCRNCCRSLAEYRLLFVGALLLVVLWLAPEGVIGTLARLLPPRPIATALRRRAISTSPHSFAGGAQPLDGDRDIGISFGGIKAATDVELRREPGRITSVIGPNGAGKTTVLNMIGGFYRPDTGSIRSAASNSPARRPGASRAPASRGPTRPRSCSAR